MLGKHLRCHSHLLESHTCLFAFDSVLGGQVAKLEGAAVVQVQRFVPRQCPPIYCGSVSLQCSSKAAVRGSIEGTSR